MAPIRRRTNLIFRLVTVLPAAALALAFSGCRPEPVPGDMALIPAGTFRMGADNGAEGEGPVHSVKLGAFYIDRTEVTNAEFARFVRETGYRTRSEDEGASAVFNTPTGKWEMVNGADWRHPAGPTSSIDGRDNYPVVQVCWDDAAAFARWAGKRLPTEAEWEYASRGGLDGKTYAWGDERDPGGKFMANYWQGTFPSKNTGADGYPGLAPAAKFPPNGYGLYDMTGNAWEWVSDFYSPGYYQECAAQGTVTQPPGPPAGADHSIRGGSFLCAANFCARYRVAGRMHSTADSAWNHTGFRCARDAP